MLSASSASAKKQGQMPWLKEEKDMCFSIMKKVWMEFVRKKGPKSNSEWGVYLPSTVSNQDFLVLPEDLFWIQISILIYLKVVTRFCQLRSVGVAEWRQRECVSMLACLAINEGIFSRASRVRGVIT